MAFFEYERPAAGSQRFGITVQHGVCGIVELDRESVLLLRDRCARDQPNEIDRIGHPCNLVEIIDSPDQPPFGVAPRAKIFHVKVTHRQHAGSLGETSTDIEPQWNPAIEGRS